MPFVPNFLNWLGLLIFLGALVAAALRDFMSYEIPNRYPAMIMASFVIYAINEPGSLWLGSLMAAIMLLVPGTVLLACGRLGGGDVKLLAAVALWAGIERLPLLLQATALAGGALALLYLSPLHRFVPAHPGTGTPSSGAGSERQPRLRAKMPYGVAIAFGGAAIAVALITS